MGVAAKYYIPGRNPLTDQYTLGLDIQKFTPKSGKSISEQLSVAYVKTIEWWQSTISLNLLHENYHVDGQPDEVSGLLYPNWTISRIHADNMIFPKKGSNISLSLQGANRQFLSSTNFFQAEVKGKYIFSPTDASRMILRGDLGYTVVNTLSRLPLTLRYFAGGINSVRGYAFSSIGPGRYLELAA